jgi:hypothetical protein
MPDDPESASKKNEATAHLEHVLRSVEEKGAQLAGRGRAITWSGQYIQDLAHETFSVVRSGLPPGAVEVLIVGFEVIDHQADRALATIGVVSVPAVNSTAGTAASAIAIALNPIALLQNFPAEERPLALNGLLRVRSVAMRGTETERVLEMMRQHGLDTAAKGRKSPAELFKTAHDAFEAPVSPGNPISTSLIPIRSAINDSIAELIRRRPRQEPAKHQRDKILSIGRQFKRDDVADEVVESWADQWTILLKRDLHPSKDADFSREQWALAIENATLFLKSVLEGLDPSKTMRAKG